LGEYIETRNCALGERQRFIIFSDLESLLNMTGLQDRLDTAFGGLGDLSTGNSNPPWRPAQHNIFRSGPEVDDYAEDEYNERLRREVVSGMAMDLAEEDHPNEDGFMPSTAFCRQLDEEDDLDGVDTTAASLFSNEYRPAPGTEVLELNTYDSGMHSIECRTPMDEDEEEEDRSNNDEQHQPSPRKSRLVFLSSRGPSKSNLRTSSSRQTTLKKRVSFTGIPDPPVPWVPPHKRENFISTSQESTIPPSPAKISAASADTISFTNEVPDHVINPHKYTRYEFDEPVLVGGGTGQLRSSEHDQQPQEQRHGVVAIEIAQPSSLTLENVVEKEGERWQGDVGAGIEFRRRVVENSNGGGGSGSCRATLEQQQQQTPTVRPTFRDFEQEDALEEVEDASVAVATGVTAGGASMKKQYRRTTTAPRHSSSTS
jgi:hypothetical protein